MRLSKTKILAILAAGGLLAGGPLRAQESTNAPAMHTNAAPHIMMRGPNMDGFAKMLNLTDAQKNQFEPVLISERQQIRAVFQDTTLSSQEKRDKITTIRGEANTNLQSILTADQFEKWQRMTEPRNRRMMPPAGTTNAPAGAPH